MNDVALKLHVGRRVRFHAGYGGTGGEGVIVAVHGAPNRAPVEHRGIMRVVRPDDCLVDVILFDGRQMMGRSQCGFDRPGIGLRLLDRVHGPAMVERVRQLAAARVAREAVEAVQAADRFERNEAARVIADPPLFYWNGIKDAKGAKLQRAFFSDYGPTGSVSGKYPPHTLGIAARDYHHFSAKVHACFAVTNDSDLMTDYFDNDRIAVIPSHPLYARVLAAYQAQQAHYAKPRSKRA